MLLETEEISIIKIGNTIRLVGYAVISAETPKWTNIIDFTFISPEYKPKNNIGFINLGSDNDFELHRNGFIQNRSVLSAGTYYFDVSWKI